MGRTVIQGARVVDPSRGVDGAYSIVIEDGVIAGLAGAGEPVRGEKVVDARGMVACPGFIDLHCHLREPGGEAAESIATGCRSAAAGGFTTVFCMPNTNPVCDNAITVRYMLDRAAGACGVRVVPVASVTLGQQGELLSDFAALKEAGAGALSDDGRPVGSSDLMRRAMEHASTLGMVIFDHCEDMSLTGDGVMHEGSVALRLGLKGIPRASEATIVARDCALSLMTGCRLHVCHVSNVESVEAIRHFKRRGAPVTAEVSPHHLTLTHDAVRVPVPRAPMPGGYSTHAKMKPPLCEESDRLALIEALEDGTIDCIATDHAPHTPATKATTFDAAPFGIIGFETAFPVLYTSLVKPGRWTLEFLIEKMSAAPARVMGDLEATRGRGTLSPGSPADVALLRLDGEWEYTESGVRSRSRNSPWIGSKLAARVMATVCGGRVIEHGA